MQVCAVCSTRISDKMNMPVSRVCVEPRIGPLRGRTTVFLMYVSFSSKEVEHELIREKRVRCAENQQAGRGEATWVQFHFAEKRWERLFLFASCVVRGFLPRPLPSVCICTCPSPAHLLCHVACSLRCHLHCVVLLFSCLVHVFSSLQFDMHVPSDLFRTTLCVVRST